MLNLIVRRHLMSQIFSHGEVRGNIRRRFKPNSAVVIAVRIHGALGAAPLAGVRGMIGVGSVQGCAMATVSATV